jgi:intracellular multiplication protein IcmP
MKGSGGGGQQQTGQGMDGLYIAAFLVLFSIIIWWKFKAQVVSLLLNIKYYEIILVEEVIDLLLDITSWIGLPQPDMASLEYTQSVILDGLAAPEQVSLTEIGVVSSEVGSFTAIPLFLVSMILGSVLFVYHSASRFCSVYNMQKLRLQENVIWPQFSPVLHENLVDIDIDKGHWRMSEQPMQFAKKHDLLEEYIKDGKTLAKVRREAAVEVFSAQMGAIWDARVDTQPPYVQALFAAFAAKAEDDSEACKVLLYQISKSALSGKLDFSGTRQLLHKHIKSKKVGRAAGPHAYVLTMMASMLDLARENGVLATADFLWLKSIDRKLWYMLNTVGRRTAFPEVGGPFAHWIVEKRLRRPLKVPVVVTAVDALDEAISLIVYKKDED